jgi:uncharacterized protein (TIGR04551 family)
MRNLITIVGVCAASGVLAVAGIASAETEKSLPAVTTDVSSTENADLAAVGAELTPRKYAASREQSAFEIHGSFRTRGRLQRNFDLDRGTDPSGATLYPLPADGGQWISTADARLRTDLTFYPRGVGVSVKARVDWLSDVGLGSTPVTGQEPSNNSASATGQAGVVPLVRRAWGEVLLPAGVLAVGRMGAHFGLGMVANGGDRADSNAGDSADRIAYVVPLFGHIIAASHDFSSSGPYTVAANRTEIVDLTRHDDVATTTFAVMKWSAPATVLRRAAAGRTTIDYAGYISRRTQAQDLPAGSNSVVARDFAATSVGGWLRVVTPLARIEAEAVFASATVGQPSQVAGVELTQAATAKQWGAAAESEVAIGPRVTAGLNAGVASGDSAPGFGVNVSSGQGPTVAGDIDGPQAHFPRDTTVDNLRFHPNYIVDQILFRRIIGTVTDAAFVKPHVSATLLRVATTTLRFDGAVIASWAMKATSTPSGARHLGVELDSDVVLNSDDGFWASLGYAVLLPGPAFDNTMLSARPAQQWRADIGMRF